jgi:hypothetical protein
MTIQLYRKEGQKYIPITFVEVSCHNCDKRVLVHYHSKEVFDNHPETFRGRVDSVKKQTYWLRECVQALTMACPLDENEVHSQLVSARNLLDRVTFRIRQASIILRQEVFDDGK